MILCLIWLLSYEGSISNPFQVRRNAGADIAVVLVLLQTQNRVVEIVVVHFVQLSFFNSLQRISIQWLQSSFEQHLKFFSLSTSDDLQLLMTFRCFWWRQLLVTSFWRECFWWRQLQDHLSSEPLFFSCFKFPSCWFHCSDLFFQNLCLN